MATIKNTSLFTALTGVVSQITSNDNGYKALSVIKANFTEGATNKNYVDSFAYGEYSLANIAQVTNTISELAKHVYNNFIPNDRIIPNKKADKTTDIIFYKKVGNAYDNMKDTISGKAADYKNYIVTGQNLYNNIKYHKPFINNTQDYSESNYFIVPTGIPSTDAGNTLQAQRVGSAYVWNANKDADWYRVHILPDAPTTGKTAANDFNIDTTNKTLDIKIDNTLTGSITNNSNAVIVLNKDFGFETFTLSSAGLVKKVDKSTGYAISGDGLSGKSVNVLTDSLEKRKITFTDAGLVQSVEKAGEYTLTGSVTDNSNSVTVLNKDFGFEEFTFTDAGLVEKVNNTNEKYAISGTGLSNNSVTLLSKDFDFEEFTFTDAGLVKTINKGENYTLTGNVTDRDKTVTVLNKDFSFETFTFTKNGLVEKVENTGEKYAVEGLSGGTVSVLTNNLEKRDFTFTENGLLKSVGEGTALNTLTGLNNNAITVLDSSFTKRDFTFTTAGLLNKVEDKGAVNTVTGMPADKKITLLNDSFGRETFTLTDAGLITEIESTAGDTISGLDSGDITLLNGSLEKKKLTFSDAGILTKVEDNGGKLNTLSGNGLSDKSVTVLGGDFVKRTFTLTENGLVNTVVTGDSFTVLKDTTAVSSDFSLTVLLEPDSSGDTVKKTTLTFNKYGLLTKYTTPANTSYKLMYEGNSQTFTGLKSFSSGIGLPSSSGDLIVG